CVPCHYSPKQAHDALLRINCRNAGDYTDCSAVIRLSPGSFFRREIFVSSGATTLSLAFRPLFCSTVTATFPANSVSPTSISWTTP
ncbi:MAG TPA: hypothetical protein PLF25_09695, partial [Accumulibacter sp.]|nr:hypothetical protein [Accumulibacter sp.]